MNTENKIIAEFMGYKQFESYSEDIQMVSYRIEKDNQRIGELTNYVKYKPETKEDAIFRLWNQLNLSYHSDWNWLMEVVEKIESLGNDVLITTNYVKIIFDEGEQEILINEVNIKIQAVYDACVEFIKWYNEISA